MNKKQFMENAIHGIFLILGLITVGCVLLITVYLVISGIPAIRKIGVLNFLFGKKWASTAAQPQYGIFPFILTSIYGTAGAIVLGVPIGFMTAVYLAKIAPLKIKTVIETAVSLLAGIPSVVYGLVGMMVLVPGIRIVFHIPDGASLFAAIIVLAIMILPSIIKVSLTALEAVPKAPMLHRNIIQIRYPDYFFLRFRLYYKPQLTGTHRICIIRKCVICKILS